MSKINVYKHHAPLILESGAQINDLTIAYELKGTYQPGVSKVVWVCHALTANAEVSDWWSGLFGAGAWFDRDEYVFVCANILGSCYGTSGPLTPDANGVAPYLDFPQVSTRDMAQAHDILREALGINNIYLLIGASLGGQQAQEFAILLKQRLQHLILIATNAFHSPFGRAFNEAQRLALLADPTFDDKTPEAGRNGLIAARSIAMLSYRSYEGYRLTQSETSDEVINDFKAATYQRYQGEKLANRFHAASYWILSKAMDAHHLGRNRASVEAALREIEARALVIGISSDLLFPLSEQRFLAQHLRKAEFHTIHSDFGHDGFLVETNQLERLIDDFLNNQFKGFKPTTFKSLKNTLA